LRIVHSPAGITHQRITIRSHTCRIACSWHNYQEAVLQKITRE